LAGGLAPDCWKESRHVHGQGDWDWKANVKISQARAERLKNGILSPNQGYSFLFEGGRPDGKLTIYAEKNYLIVLAQQQYQESCPKAGCECIK